MLGHGGQRACHTLPKTTLKKNLPPCDMRLKRRVLQTSPISPLSLLDSSPYPLHSLATPAGRTTPGSNFLARCRTLLVIPVSPHLLLGTLSNLYQFYCSYPADEVNLTETTEIKAPQATFSPGMTIDQNGVLYLCSADNAIYRLEPGNDHVELFGGVPGRDGGGVGANGKLLKAGEAYPMAANFENSDSASAAPLHHLPRTNSNGALGLHGYGKFTRIFSLDAIGTPGYIWVADYDAHVLRKIDCQNDYVMAMVGRAGSGGSYDGDVSDARLSHPRSIIATTILSMSNAFGPSSAPSLPSHSTHTSKKSKSNHSIHHGSSRASSAASTPQVHHKTTTHHGQVNPSDGSETVLFMASGTSQLRRVDLRTNKVSTLKLKSNNYEAMISSGESSVNDLFNPSLVHPLLGARSSSSPPNSASSRTSSNMPSSSSRSTSASLPTSPHATNPNAASIIESTPLDFNKPTTNNPCTTWAHTSRQATWRINLETGDCSVLSDKYLYPLVCFEENIVLVVEGIRDWEYNACISVAYCPPANEDDTGLNDTPVTLKQLGNLPGNWLDKKARFTYCHLTNMLYAWNITNGSLVRFSNVLPADLLHELAPSNGYVSDLSPLLGSPIPHNLLVHHAASKRSWNLHSDVLSCHAGLETKDRLRKLEATIHTSSLPASSINALINYLYHKRIDTTDLNKACTETCHVIALCEAVGLDTRFLASELATRIVAKMSNDSICQQLLAAWFNKDIEWSETSAVIVILVERIRKHAQAVTFLSSFDTLDLNDIPPARIAKRTAIVTHLISPATSLKQPTLSTFPPTIPAISLSTVGKASSKTGTEKNPTRYLSAPTDFVFCIQGQLQAGFVVANGWRLYPRWHWFARMINAGLEEASTRVVYMPSWMTPTILLAILSAPHGTSHTHLSHLTIEEMTKILQHGRELGLLDANGSAVSVFKTIIKRCCDKVFEPLDHSNCFRMLGRLVQIGIEEKIEEALSFISTHRDQLSIKHIVLLDSDLIEMVKKRLQ